MTSPHILVTDDDPEIGRLLGRYLESQGFRCSLATDRRSCEKKIAEGNFDLLVLDVMLPDGSGLDICRDMKDVKPHLPVILLTALKEDVDRIIGLELGADDYLGKPFNPRELSARIKAVLRRTGGQNDGVPGDEGTLAYRFEGFVASPSRRQVVGSDGEEVVLTGAEFDLLMIFLERPNRVLSRDLLMDHLHGRSVEPYDRAIDVTMSRLRRKFDDGGKFRLFKTVRNGGYQFAAPVEKLSGGPA
ncbi:response regulator transcription factor [Fulvimarina sp. 2208YS6-2-32]|uniref:Response regulator transcription factor n=1 Tax=Fulvimarina uroteuthidis TaxID=3098149 RepID=A0ABU5I4J1_9HYPH|nr:response regulator transcription factor [Fulvimarina sp. 2208YS6-2-32]MDY8110007.1 response regulator transcription factor [Fulvimarina sp. 2208YS6-2-32]